MSLLRAASTALKNALASGALVPPASSADLVTLTLLSGTVYRWTSYDSTLTVGSNVFSPAQPWISRGQWSVQNTMSVDTLELNIDSNAPSFASGPPLQTQVINGLFDGATFFLQRVFMPTPGDTSTWGTVDLFLGDAGAATMVGARALVKARAKSSRLDVNAPRNLFQASCRHSFCDAGCTLSAATYTTSRVVGSSPVSTRSVVTSSTVLPILGQTLKGGTLRMTSGVASGQVRSIIANGLNAVTLAYPLIAAPSAGDTFTVFQGCDKTATACVFYGNFVNYGAFPFVPAPATVSP